MKWRPATLDGEPLHVLRSEDPDALLAMENAARDHGDETRRRQILQAVDKVTYQGLLGRTRMGREAILDARGTFLGLPQKGDVVLTESDLLAINRVRARQLQERFSSPV